MSLSRLQYTNKYYMVTLIEKANGLPWLHPFRFAFCTQTLSHDIDTTKVYIHVLRVMENDETLERMRSKLC